MQLGKFLNEAEKNTKWKTVGDMKAGHCDYNKMLITKGIVCISLYQNYAEKRKFTSGNGVKVNHHPVRIFLLSKTTFLNQSSFLHSCG